MSELDSLKSEPEAKRILKGVHFDFKGAHLAYTDASQGGAASLQNESYLLKSGDISSLTEEQKNILKKINEDSTPLEKSGGVNKDEGSPQVNSEDSPSLEKEVGGLHNTDDNSVEKHNNMTDLKEVQKELSALKQELEFQKAKNEVAFLGLEKEQGEALSKALATLSEDDKGVVIDAIKSIKEAGEEALSKALEGKEEGEENLLAKSLQDEEGEEGEAEPLSFTDSVIKAQNEQRGDK